MSVRLSGEVKEAYLPKIIRFIKRKLIIEKDFIKIMTSIQNIICYFDYLIGLDKLIRSNTVIADT